MKIISFYSHPFSLFKILSKSAFSIIGKLEIYYIFNILDVIPVQKYKRGPGEALTSFPYFLRGPGRVNWQGPYMACNAFEDLCPT